MQHCVKCHVFVYHNNTHIYIRLPNSNYANTDAEGQIAMALISQNHLNMIFNNFQLPVLKAKVFVHILINSHLQLFGLIFLL